MGDALPTGTVTFLFTDVEGSTKLWEDHPVDAGAMLARHDELIEEIVAATEGVVVRPRGEGDSRFVVFARASDAVGATLEIRRAFLKEPWPLPLRVRMALHTGEAELRAGDYYGPAVNRRARIRAIAHGGQTLVSAATEELVGDALPAEAWFKDLGAHRLKDLTKLEQVFQLCGAELDESFPALRSIDRLPNNLPVQLTSFVGRDDEVRDVRKLLQESRLVALTGAAGCGKTRLALHVGAEMLEGFTEGVWFVDLAPVADPSLVSQATARALGVQEEPSRSLSDTLVEFLRDRRLLLILDNCEHVLAAAARLATDLLLACPDLHVLATGREALGVAGEVAWRVPSLQTPDPSSTQGLEALTQFDAVRLFIYRARAASPDLVLTDEDASVVAQICARLDGIPLAIELAAARADFLTPDQIAARLDDRFRLLTGGSRTALERQQTLRAAVDWSYALLDEREKTLFRRLSVFAGGFTLEACEEVCAGGDVAREEILDLMQGLGRKSLVVVEKAGRTARYRLLEMMRQYGREKMLDAPEGDLREKHLRWCAAFASEAAGNLEGPEQVAWMRALDAEHDNMRAALEWATRPGGDPDAALWLAANLVVFWEVRGHWTEGRRWIKRALAMEGSSDDARAYAERAAGVLAWRQGDFDEADALCESALRHARVSGDRWLLGRATYGLATTALLRRDLARVGMLADEALEIAERLGDARLLANSLNMRAQATMDTAEHVALGERALEVARAAGDVRTTGVLLHNLGYLAQTLGDYQRARALLSEAQGPISEIGDKIALIAQLQALAQVTFFQGDWTAARALYEETAPLARELGGKTGKVFGTDIRARIAYLDGDYAGALPFFDELRHEAHEDGVPAYEAWMLFTVGHVLYLQGECASARARLSEAEHLATSLDMQWFRATIRDEIARVERAMGNLEQASALHRESLVVHQGQGGRGDVVWGLEGLGAVEAAAGRGARAARILGAAEALREGLESAVWPSRRPEYDASIEQARAACSAEEFAKAWAEGRAMSLEEAVAYALEQPGPTLEHPGSTTA